MRCRLVTAPWEGIMVPLILVAVVAGCAPSTSVADSDHPDSGVTLPAGPGLIQEDDRNLSPVPTDPPVDGPIPTDEVFVGTLPPIGSTSTTTVAACAAFTLLGIEFESGSEALTAASLALVDDLAAKLRETPEPWNLRIVGHTDSRTFNGPGGNQGLSERRAAAVAEAVQATGVIPSATVTTSTGVANRHPVAVGDDPTALAANRRVEVIVICT